MLLRTPTCVEEGGRRREKKNGGVSNEIDNQRRGRKKEISKWTLRVVHKERGKKKGERRAENGD